MKVALVVPGFSAHERDWCIPALLDFVREMARRAEVHVFSLRWPERRDRYQVFGADVRSLGGSARLGARAPLLWVQAITAMRAEHRLKPFDVIHAFWVDEPGWVAALAGAWLGAPVVLSLAGGELAGLPDIGYGLQILPGRPAWVRWLLRRADIVTAGSDYLLTLASAQMPSERHGRLRAAPLGVNLDRFRPAAGVRQEQGWVGLNVGALYPVKGQAMLLRAAARVPKVRVRIVGEGPLRVRLEQLAGELGLLERLELMGGVDHGALAEVYGAARVFVQTSRHEAQGMALLEAAACGVPAVGTPVGVLPEVGWTAGTEAELAEALRQLLSDEPQRQALGRSARERVAERYALEPAVGEFRRLYAEAAAQRR